MINLELRLNYFKRGRETWKFNSSLLNDKNDLNQINKTIDEVRRQYAVPIYNKINLTNRSDQDIQFTIND